MNYPQRGHKPAAKHPWRNYTPDHVRRWALEQSQQTKVTDFATKGGHQPWNGGNEPTRIDNMAPSKIRS